jgi:hypothetical protein
MIPELQELQQLIAELTIGHGVERIITQEILEERCLHYFEVAKKELEEIGPEPDPDHTDFQPIATVFGARGEEARRVPCGFTSGQKRRMMYALSKTCETILAQALILRHVGTIADMRQIAKAMHLNEPDPYNRQKMKYFEERMWKWIEQNYGRQRLAALPPEFRHDVLFVMGMGPKLKDCGCMAVYRWKDGHFIIDAPRIDGEVRMMLVPRWWE